jgi:hypothetical protein
MTESQGSGFFFFKTAGPRAMNKLGRSLTLITERVLTATKRFSSRGAECL